MLLYQYAGNFFRLHGAKNKELMPPISQNESNSTEAYLFF